MMHKPLYIFDFDDTLALSDAKVVVTHKNGKVEDLSSAEYAVYREKPGDIFDFEQFHGYPPNGRLVRNTFAELEKALAQYPVEDVVVLTAREYCGPIIKFLKDQGISKIPTMKCVSGADAALKGNYVANRIREDGHTEVHVFEDSLDNLAAIKTTMKNFPDVVYNPVHVQVQNEGTLRAYVKAVLLEMREVK